MELGNGVTVNFLEIAQNDPNLLLEAATEIVEAAQAESIALPQFAGANVVAATTQAEAEPEAERSIFDQLTAEQQERATAATAAQAEKFDRKESDFSVVKSTNEAGESIFAVALTATESLDLGNPKKAYDSKRNWDKVTTKDNDARFIIEVEGQKVDTRDKQDMQWLSVVAAANPEINEYVWRTGEQDLAGRDVAPIADLDAGQAYPDPFRRSFDDWCIGFRPVVVI
jgi:hypothetical protein